MKQGRDSTAGTRELPNYFPLRGASAGAIKMRVRAQGHTRPSPAVCTGRPMSLQMACRTRLLAQAEIATAQ